MTATATNTQLSVNIESVTLPINQLRVELEGETKRFKSRKSLDKHLRVVTPDGRRMTLSPRFWRTFCQTFGLSRNVFDYFSYNEVLDRVAQKKKSDVRISCEMWGRENGYAHGKLLSCTNPNKPLLRVDEVNELIEKNSGSQVTYNEGVASVTFDCPFPMNMRIGDSDFQTMFTMALPMDGYGLPAAYLTLLRLVCTNGMVGMSKAFKSSFQLGSTDRSMVDVLERNLESFNNEEGFHAFRERIEAAQKSWASLHNMLTLTKAVNASANEERLDPSVRSQIHDMISAVAGAPLAIYGVTSGSEPAPRMAKTLPIKCTVYDLLNLSSELSTHHFKQLRSRNRLNAWVGDIISNEYDLENTVETFPDFTDFFISDSVNIVNGK